MAMTSAPQTWKVYKVFVFLCVVLQLEFVFSSQQVGLSMKAARYRTILVFATMGVLTLDYLIALNQQLYISMLIVFTVVYGEKVICHQLELRK